MEQQHLVLCFGRCLVVQSVLRTVIGQGLPQRVANPHDALLLHPNGAQCRILQRMGHHPEGMEGLFTQNYCRAHPRHRGAHHLEFPATMGITKNTIIISLFKKILLEEFFFEKYLLGKILLGS